MSCTEFDVVGGACLKGPGLPAETMSGCWKTRFRVPLRDRISSLREGRRHRGRQNDPAIFGRSRFGNAAKPESSAPCLPCAARLPAACVARNPLIAAARKRSRLHVRPVCGRGPGAVGQPVFSSAQTWTLMPKRLRRPLRIECIGIPCALLVPR